VFVRIPTPSFSVGIVYIVGPRNVMAKIPEDAEAETKAAYWQIFDTDELASGDKPVQSGPELVAAAHNVVPPESHKSQAQARIDNFAGRYRILAGSEPLFRRWVSHGSVWW
jgi:hypothetical protein